MTDLDALEQAARAEPTTRAGRWLVDRSRWDEGMRGFFVRINATAGPDDMHRHIIAIEREAAAAAAREADALREAARLVIANWEQGDLATAVRKLAAALDDGE